jgi:Gpi18-like mannosyltransferase
MKYMNMLNYKVSQSIQPFNPHNLREHCKRALIVYAVLSMALNVYLLDFESHGGDMGFWRDWTIHLQGIGYKNFSGNYPPIYIHWLYLIGQMHSALSIPIELGTLLKFFTQIPVGLAHLTLIIMTYRIMSRNYTSLLHFHVAMVLISFNPALLINGPIWGQIDALPLVPLIGALLASQSVHWRLATLPLYALALLIKFQMIAFAPVFGVLFIQHWRVHLLGAALILSVMFVSFLPHIIADNFNKTATEAYINAAKTYPYASMNAANLMYLLFGNMTPDQQTLLTPPIKWLPSHFLTVKYLGIVTCFLIFLAVFVKGLIHLYASYKHRTEQNIDLTWVLSACTICSVTFFAFLPGMHERYLVPAVVVSCFLFAMHAHNFVYPILLTYISAINMVMICGINIVNPLSSLSVLLLLLNQAATRQAPT